MKWKGIKSKLMERRTVLVIVLTFIAIVSVGIWEFNTQFTVIQNEPKDMVLDAKVVINADGKMFTWGRGEAIPQDFKETVLNGTLQIGMVIEETNVDILDLRLEVSGPISGTFDMLEEVPDIWSVDYDTTGLEEGTYAFYIKGNIDTTPLYADPSLGGGVREISYSSFNVVWEDEGGTPEEMAGIPTEYLLIGGVVLVLLLFTGGRRRQQGQVVVVTGR